MKKLFALALIAATFAACNGGETKTEDAAAAAADSLANHVEAMADSAISSIDTSVAKVDSTVAAAVDSIVH